MYVCGVHVEYDHSHGGFYILLDALYCVIT